MLKKLARTLGLATLLLSATTQALPIVQADAFTAGDNKAVLETSTGLVWMDFDVTVGQSYEQVMAKLNSHYLGWRPPTEQEVFQLWSNLFSSLEWIADQYGPNTGSGRNISDVSVQVMDIFGTNFFFQSSGYYHSAYSVGLFKGDDNSSRYAYINYDDLGSESSPYVISTAEIAPFEIGSSSLMFSVLLVKSSSVPEPSPLILLGLSLLGFGVARRRRN